MAASSMKAQYLDGNSRAWGDINYREDPWVYRVSRPNIISRGLLGRHLSLWASHGRYYDASRKEWQWQRPLLFCTNEDLFTQTIVVPFLIPMLENAGATVFTPRERDWQTHEYIIDNDDSSRLPYYYEVENGKRWSRCDSAGYQRHEGIYYDGENPFIRGTARQAKATKKKRQSTVSYQPRFEQEGRYAVYVSYKTLPKSVPDARYIVYHKGVATEFTVNQRMGGSTWVYLGTFDFDEGCSEQNRVVVTNHSSSRGVVTTDAVRFGGGMGNISRGGSVSHLPRCLEGARYYAQWAGAPYDVYSSKNGADDYGDDINVRSLMTSWLGGGSVYMPTHEGLHVPIELSLAIHSDAGYSNDGKGIIGNLAIATTAFNDGMLDAGISRQTSLDFAKALLENETRDIKAKYGLWNQRYLWDKNYSETRLPLVPSAILETLSHQNFPDMRMAQNPMFRFTLARSIYKTILRYVASNHGEQWVVQPLPPRAFTISLRKDGKALLSWRATDDAQEPSAKPTSYNIYLAEGQKGFDNGTNVRSTSALISLQPGVLYSFRVTACNDGGESFPTEVLSVRYDPQATKKILIVNGFHRLASPQVVDNGQQQGFDLDADAGVSYGLTAGWAGRQKNFLTVGRGSSLGVSGDEMAGHFVAGNDFDYTAAHALSIASAGHYNIESCSSEVIEDGSRSMQEASAVDLILGLERHDGYTPEYYKALKPSMRRALSGYLARGGRVMMSGSYIASDAETDDERQFLADAFGVGTADPDSMRLDSIGNVVARRNAGGVMVDTLGNILPEPEEGDSLRGLGLTMTYYKALNAQHYAAQHPDRLFPLGDAFCAMQYGNGKSAAVARRHDRARTLVMGVPWECIREQATRREVMRGILAFLLE